jgi:hypothetical protein
LKESGIVIADDDDESSEDDEEDDEDEDETDEEEDEGNQDHMEQEEQENPPVLADEAELELEQGDPELELTVDEQVSATRQYYHHFDLVYRPISV